MRKAHNNLANIYGEIKQYKLSVSQYKKAYYFAALDASNLNN